MFYPADKLSMVFRNTSGHVESSEIIIAHSTNKEDIREFALHNLKFKNAISIIDLGCGFGFFTQALKGRISRQAVVTGIDCYPQYRESYLSLCRESGFNGRFYDSGIEALSGFQSGSAELILSSFSIYFFPEIMPKVVSLIKNKGTFIIITHYSTHLKELTSLIKEILNDLRVAQPEPLPHDRLIGNFPAEEGIDRLTGYFKKIEKRDYNNELVFNSESASELMKYVNYKKSFFLPETVLKNPKLSREAESMLLNKISKMKEFRITKNDAVYICTHPIKM
jgi:ubiquinone/menaquinone biosynthesis C-methylase UbiE